MPTNTQYTKGFKFETAKNMGGPMWTKTSYHTVIRCTLKGYAAFPQDETAAPVAVIAGPVRCHDSDKDS